MLRDVRTLLEQYVSSSDAQQDCAREALTLWSSRGLGAFERTCFIPGHFTASAFILCPESSSALLIWHRKLEKWLQPGGHFEPTDVSPLYAAQREASEETGLLDLTPLSDALLDVDVHAIPARPDEPRHFHYDLRFAFVAAGTDVQPSDEVGAAKWVLLNEKIDADDSVARVFRKLTRMLHRESV